MYAGFCQADVVCVSDVGDVEAGEGGDWQGRRVAEVIKVNYSLSLSVEVGKVKEEDTEDEEIVKQ